MVEESFDIRQEWHVGILKRALICIPKGRKTFVNRKKYMIFLNEWSQIKINQSRKVISTQEILPAVLSLVELCLPPPVAEGGLFFIFRYMEFSCNWYLSEYGPSFEFISRHYMHIKCHMMSVWTPLTTPRDCQTLMVRRLDNGTS
jgi:hypothetical protein